MNKNIEYKNSGIEWIGKIPEYWKVGKLKYYIVYSNSGKIISKEYWGNGSETLYSCSINPIISHYSAFPKHKRTNNGDILITRNATPYIHLPKPNSIYTNVTQRIQLSNYVHTMYIYYSLKMNTAFMVGDGDIIESFNMSIWNNLPIPLPPKEEQKKIANFLDNKVKSINNVIYINKKLIKNYKEQKESLIYETITKGLDNNIEYKDSGIEWIGKIPKHWNRTKLGHLCSITNGSYRMYHKNKIKFNIPIYGANGIIGYTNKVNIKQNAIITGRVGTIGTYWLVQNVWANDNTIMLTPYKGENLKFIYYVLNSIDITPYISKTAQPLITSTSYKQYKIPLPPKEEQEKIADYLDREVKRIDTTIEIKEKQIKLFEEYRDSLIYEYVTGKKLV